MNGLCKTLVTIIDTIDKEKSVLHKSILNNKRLKIYFFSRYCLYCVYFRLR